MACLECARVAPILAAARRWAQDYDGFLAQPMTTDLPTLEAGIEALRAAVADYEAHLAMDLYATEHGGQP